ncbi:hypothetical protein K450DRAFT_280825 [Umbelopsis ramanniana AG]|uniref:Homeobox domain-containing protein n=1 Tax=Umbelopsis ramanniana AG TaxID=1314678 RepID=A0AAD5EA18_UMBRA|nr:uncharacterized protein K450DRAFT_280825 [Umbelopsis ramanniana AG]KAI8579424.1 hypothetical protein K450DRAFT_280825 [Umbelopsis ramanniana AG]
MAYLATHSLPTPASDRAASSPPSDSSSDDSYFNHRKKSSITLLLNPKDDSPTRSTSIKKAMSTTKAKRKRITPDQFSQLMALFEHNDTPSYEIRDKLAGKIGMSNREIQVWFQNRRAKANRAKTNEKLRSAATIQPPQDYGVQFMPVIAPPHRHSYHWRAPIPTPGIDLLASAAEYVQREEERLRKNNNRASAPISFYHSIPTNPSVT